jgi:ubiquinone/menaquinone biosynthesis C-methylase UbiE
MNDPKQATAYAGRDLDNAYWLFEQCFRKYIPDLHPDSTILDIGCGPAAIALRLARRFPDCTIHGVDGAEEMLIFGKQAVQKAKLEEQIQLIHGMLPDKLSLPCKSYEVIISNSFLHHLPDPMVLWNTIREHGGSATKILMIDLLRPKNDEQAEMIIDKYMPHAPALLRLDMMLSLKAAFTMEEIQEQLREAGLAVSLKVAMASPFQCAVHGTLDKI